MARTADITITFPAAPHRPLFSGTSARVHPRGHLWLLNDASPVTVVLTIGGGYTFNGGGGADPTQAFFTSQNPNPTAYSDCGGEFGNLSLTAGNTVFSFSSQNSNGQKYYYQLNFIDPGGTPFPTTDPIIVNRG